MRDAIADLVRDGDTVAIEGFTHLIGFSAGHEIIRQRKRDLTLARMTPDVIYDQMIAGGVARKLIFSWLGNPGVGGLNAIRRRIEPASVGEGTRARGRGVQPLRDGRPLHRGRREPAVHAAALVLRDGPAGGQPADPPDPVALLRRGRVRRPAAQPGRHDRPRAARRRRRQHPGLGPARLPEGGGVRRRPRDRRRRGAGRRGGDPRRPQPHDHPGPDRGRRGRRPVRRPPLVRPGRATTATTASTSTGTRSAATRTRSRRGCASGSTTSTGGAAYVEKLGSERVAGLRPGSAPSGSVDYGSYD